MKRNHHKIGLQQSFLHPSDIKDVFVRENKAASMGLSLKQYETLLRNIGVDYGE